MEERLQVGLAVNVQDVEFPVFRLGDRESCSSDSSVGPEGTSNGKVDRPRDGLSSDRS